MPVQQQTLLCHYLCCKSKEKRKNPTHNPPLHIQFALCNFYFQSVCVCFNNHGEKSRSRIGVKDSRAAWTVQTYRCCCTLLEGVPKKSSITSTNYFPLAIGGAKLGRKLGVLRGFLLEEVLLGFLVPTGENWPVERLWTCFPGWGCRGKPSSASQLQRGLRNLEENQPNKPCCLINKCKGFYFRKNKWFC